MSALPTPKQLRYLVTLSQELHFTRAATASHVTQSTLSASVRELEELLQVRLVERDRHTVRLTSIGLEVVRRARGILAATQDLVDHAASQQALFATPLGLGAIPTVAPYLLPPLLQGMRRRYPRARIALREDLTANLLTRLEGGELDFALIALPYATGQLLVEPIFDDDLWLVARSTNAEVAERKTVQLTASLTENLLLLEEGHCLREHSLQACGRAASSSSGGIEATSLLTLVQMVELDLGVGLIPEMAMNEGLGNSRSLVVRPLVKPAPHRTIALVARPSTPRLEEFTVFVNLIKEIHKHSPKRHVRG